MGAGTGNRLRKLELADVLVLAEIGAVVQFLKQDQPGALPGCFAHALFDDCEVGLGIAVVALLDQRDGEGLRLHVAIVGRAPARPAHATASGRLDWVRAKRGPAATAS